MKQIKTKRVTEPKLVDITCDICGESCRDKMDMNYEMVCLKGSLGILLTQGWHDLEL